MADEQKNRPVVTGLGMISAIGNNVAECWQNAINGVSGIKQATAVNTENCYATLAAEVNCDAIYDIPDAEKMDRVELLCIKACKEAMADACLTDFGGSVRAGVIMGSCVGGVNSAESYYRGGKNYEDINKISIMPIANHVAKAFHAGGVVTNIANACAAGTISIAYACDLIRSGKADVVIAGGADAFASVPYAGFLSLHALDENPCSPFNKCNGITLGEGAGALVIESYAHAKARGANIYCEVLGAGVSSDAYHITAPRPDGQGQMFAIRRAMDNSGISPSEIGYINAHGTGTAKNDEAEFLSLHTIFDGNNSGLCVSSTKSMVGHCLGAAGAMEAVFSIKALCEGVVPPTVGYTDEDLTRLAGRAGKIDFCPNMAERKDLTTVMSNSFAFGGNNASVVFSKEQGRVLPQSRERIFITGIGAVTPMGNGKQAFIDSITEGLTFEGNSAQSAVGVPDYNECGLKMAFYRKLDKFSQLQAVSGKLAIIDSGLDITEQNATDIGIVVGTCDGPMSTICDYQQDIIRKGNGAGSAFKFPNTVYNAAGGYLSICSCIRGYNVTVTNGTQSGLQSISYAVNIIRGGQASAVLATGTDENSDIMTELYTGLGLIADGNDVGMRLSDGSTTLVLESESAVKSRNARVYAEVAGCGTAACPVEYGTLVGSEEGLKNAILLAVEDAGISFDKIDGIVGFADGIAEVDVVERNALVQLFMRRLKDIPVLNIHSVTGEGRAATAALGAAYAAFALSGDIKTDKDLNTVLVISYGFGGTYTAIILKKAGN
ncbi:MAG: beta-ketoacyl-[acyl-carrier-protein] synthase family protein [Clostridia bacterium]|nr:beta-ketoacyl-[acyl-carrier-protein] synthase family protein [Clostridia bacterium]